jgi:hypothetical protein
MPAGAAKKLPASGAYFAGDGNVFMPKVCQNFKITSAKQGDIGIAKAC